MERIQVRLGDHEVQYINNQWIPMDDDERTLVLAEAARAISAGYEYRASHGEPGYRLANIIARSVGGEAILPPIQPAPPGTVY